MMRIALLLLLLGTCALAAPGLSGHYELDDHSHSGELQVHQLPSDTIRFELTVVEVINGNARTGDLTGEAAVHHGIATYHGHGGTLTLTFTSDACTIAQEGSLDTFGLGVTADGVWRRR